MGIYTRNYDTQHNAMARQLGCIGGYTICSWKGGEKMGYEDRDRDIHFLFEDKKWNGSSIKNMQSSHIINTLLMLRRRASEFKLNYELFIIDNMNNKLLVPKDEINIISQMDAESWIIETPIYLSLLEELESRGLAYYYDTLIDIRSKDVL